MWHGHFCPGASSITICPSSKPPGIISFLGFGFFLIWSKSLTRQLTQMPQGAWRLSALWAGMANWSNAPFQCHFPVLSLSQPDDLCGSNTARTPFPGNVCGRAFYLKECSGPENYVIMIVLKNVWSWKVRSRVVSWEIRESCTTFLRNNCRSKTVKIATDRL